MVADAGHHRYLPSPTASTNSVETLKPEGAPTGSPFAQFLIKLFVTANCLRGELRNVVLLLVPTQVW